MNALLYFPGIIIVIMLATGLERAIRTVVLILEVQVSPSPHPRCFGGLTLKVLLAVPFTLAHAPTYVSKAFDFGRTFLWEWTVNWRFMGEKAFLSSKFAWTLLIGHFMTLLFFIITRWLQYTIPLILIMANFFLYRPSRKALYGFIKANLSHPTHPLRRDISNKTILTILFTSNMIGSLFARSLHYQFYSWTAWTMPFLLWRTGWNPAAQYGTWMIEEWAWNVFPSTGASSLAVVGVYIAVLAGVWWNWGVEEGVQGEWADARFERETRIREGVTVA